MARVDVIKTFYRQWQLTATPRTCSGKKNNYLFKINRITGGFEATLRAGKAEIDKREGPEKWIEGYVNQHLTGEAS